MDIALKDMIIEAGHSPEEADMVTKLLTRKRIYVVIATDGYGPPLGIAYFFDKKPAVLEVARLRNLVKVNGPTYQQERAELIRRGRMSNKADHELIERYRVKIGRKQIHPAYLDGYVFDYAGLDIR